MTTKHRNKAALINAIRTEHQGLENTFADLSKKDMVVKGVVGAWSLKDLLSHLTAWEKLWMEWYALSLHGRTPALLPISLKAVHALNAYIFEINHKRPLDDIVDEFAISYQEVLAVVERIPEQDMFTPCLLPWMKWHTFADIITDDTCDHYRWARFHILKWRRVHGV